ncbi:MAG: hypothetical protein Q9166_002760 [cf. Caloplaca sp. 2 TL-2023]
MDRSVRASSAPLFGNKIRIDTPDDEDRDRPRPKPPPRSPGFVNNDNSLGRVEYQNNKRSMCELKELAWTSPPNGTATKPTFPEGKATASGGRRGILEQIGANGSVPSEPLKRLFRLNRSATTSDLTREDIPRRCMEIASKHSSGGRKYMEIVMNPKLYDLKNPSTYKVNFEEVKPKGKSRKWIYRKSQARTDLDAVADNGPRQVSHLSSDSGDYCKKVMDEYPHLILGREICDPAKAVTNQANTGYSPSKGIPKPELGVQDFAAATLAIAQARARGSSLGQVSGSPERLAPQSRQRESPIRKHGNHTARRRTSSKGPYSVPIKFQLRPQRTSLPKTPRTSLDEPVTLKDTSPVGNGTAKSSPTKSGSSTVDDGQSDAESVKIMNAQSAEFMKGQGAFAYHSRGSLKPPKPGPAPTRALPSLPEGHDGLTPKSIKVETKSLLPTCSPSASGSSPKQKTPKSPPKGHRYRLSPVKNNVPADSRIRLELKPSPNFTEEFPQPPSSAVSISPKMSSDAAPRRRNREVDVTDIVGGRSFELPSIGDTTISLRAGDDRKKSSGVNVSPTSAVTEGSNNPIQRSKDAEKDNLYLPWQESRVDRVKALKARDIERLRDRQNSAAGQERDDEKPHSPAKEYDRNPENTDPSDRKQSSASQASSSAQNVKNPRSSDQPSSSKGNRASIISTKNDFSPIITVAEQTPYFNSYPPRSSSIPNSTAYNINGYLPDHTQPSQTFKSNGNFHGPHPQYSSHSSYAQSPLPNRNPNYSSTTHINPPSDIEARLEARIAAMEKRNLLLERAFLAVIDASSGFSSGYSLGLGVGGARGSGMAGGDEVNGYGRRAGVGRREEESGGRDSERMSAASEVLAPLAGRVDAMLVAMQGGRGGEGG